MLDFRNQGRREVFQLGDILMSGRLGSGSYQSVIPYSFATLLSLFRFDYANQPHLNDASGKGVIIHQNQHVKWITITAKGSGKKSEIERKYRAKGQNGFQLKETQPVVKAIFIPTPFRSFNNSQKPTFCPLELRDSVKRMIVKTNVNHTTRVRLITT
jgi:hypothetical protein